MTRQRLASGGCGLRCTHWIANCTVDENDDKSNDDDEGERGERKWMVLRMRGLMVL